MKPSPGCGLQQCKSARDRGRARGVLPIVCESTERWTHRVPTTTRGEFGHEVIRKLSMLVAKSGANCFRHFLDGEAAFRSVSLENVEPPLEDLIHGLAILQEGIWIIAERFFLGARICVPTTARSGQFRNLCVVYAWHAYLLIAQRRCNPLDRSSEECERAGSLKI